MRSLAIFPEKSHPPSAKWPMSLRSFLRLWLCLALAAALLAPLAGPARAQSAIQVSDNTGVITLPVDLTFSLSASSSANITSVTLEYGTNAQSCANSVARQKADFTPGKNVDATWVWDFKTNGGALPPGAEVWWLWEIKTDDGGVLRTDKQSLTVEDNRLTWHTVSNTQVKVVWSDGGSSFGNSMLKIATDAVNRLADSAGIRPPGQVRLTVFPSQDALRAAALFLPEWTGGVAFPEYATTMEEIPVGSDTQWQSDVIRHELAHLVTGQLTFNCLGAGMPTWLNEGISVYNEGPDSSMDFNSVTTALKNGSLMPLHTLAAGFSADTNEALLSYAYAGTIVRFMVDTYGAAKLAALLGQIQSGKLINPALQAVYSLDTDGLDETWRASLGFGSGPGGKAATALPTEPPTTVPTLALATSAFGKTVKTPKPAAPTSTPEAPAAATEPTKTPAAIAAASPEPPTSQPTQAPAATAQPTRAPASPISCLGMNALVGLGMLAMVVGVSRRSKRL